MQYTWNKLLTVIAITAFGMISAPTLSSMNQVFAASLDLSNFAPLKKLGLDKLFDKSTSNNDNQPKADDNQPKADDNQPKSNDNQPKSNDDKPKSNDDKPKSNDDKPKSSNSHAGEKCGANGGNTKDWYCHGTHHHCAKGQNDCELEGGRT
jgi:hypothetical protein